MHQLLQQKSIQDFLTSNDFSRMFERVRQDDMGSQEKNHIWLEKPVSLALIFNELDSTWQQLIPTYERDFKALVYGEVPNHSEILHSLKMIRNRVGEIT